MKTPKSQKGFKNCEICKDYSKEYWCGNDETKKKIEDKILKECPICGSSEHTDGRCEQQDESQDWYHGK